MERDCQAQTCYGGVESREDKQMVMVKIQDRMQFCIINPLYLELETELYVYLSFQCLSLFIPASKICISPQIVVKDYTECKFSSELYNFKK